MTMQVQVLDREEEGIQALLDKLSGGPVALTDEGQVTAIVLPVDEYDTLRDWVRFFERQQASDLALKTDEWMSDEDLTEAFAQVGVA